MNESLGMLAGGLLPEIGVHFDIVEGKPLQQKPLMHQRNQLS